MAPIWTALLHSTTSIVNNPYVHHGFFGFDTINLFRARGDHDCKYLFGVTGPMLDIQWAR